MGVYQPNPNPHETKYFIVISCKYNFGFGQMFCASGRYNDLTVHSLLSPCSTLPVLMCSPWGEVGLWKLTISSLSSIIISANQLHVRFNNRDFSNRYVFKILYRKTDLQTRSVNTCLFHLLRRRTILSWRSGEGAEYLDHVAPDSWWK